MPELDTKTATLIEYLDIVEDREAAQEKLRQIVEREKALAKIIYESPIYPAEVMLLVTTDRAIKIDFRESDFAEYSHPDSPIKIYPTQDAGAIMMEQLPILQEAA